jgi:hypothetical protein
MDETLVPPPDQAVSDAIPKRAGDPRSLDPVPGGCATCGQPVPAGGTAGASGCSTCGRPMLGGPFSTARGQFVCAIGRLSPQFQSIDVEKEFAQLAAEAEGPEVSEHHRLKAALTNDDNLYLTHNICWVFTTQGVDSFAVVPRDNDDARRLVDAFVPAGDEKVINVVVGRPADTPPRWDWSSSGLPLVSADQILSFTLDEFLDALGATDGGSEHGPDPDRRAAMREVFFRLTRRSDNHGVGDAHRASNYVALRYPSVYRATLAALDEGKMLLGIETRSMPSGDRRLVSVRLVFRHHHTQIVERLSCAVDVTGEFPFLAAPLSPTYD